MPDLPDAADAPVSVSTIGIKARDVAGLADYYRHTVGLSEVARRPGTIVLAPADARFSKSRSSRRPGPTIPAPPGSITRLPAALEARSRPLDPARHREAHRVTGASDHLVSEAIYLTDPEGNGIEIYADRPRSAWQYDGDQVKMATLPLDVRASSANCVPAMPAGRARPRRRWSAMFICASGMRRRRAVVERRTRLRHDAAFRRQRRVPLHRRLPPPCRRQFLAERRRQRSRPRPLWPCLRRAPLEDGDGREVVEDPWATWSGSCRQPHKDGQGRIRESPPAPSAAR